MKNQQGKILDGEQLGDDLNSKLKDEINELKKETGIEPTLATILVGSDPASEVYIKIKHRTCQDLGIASKLIKFDEKVEVETVSQKIEELNQNPKVHGILLQLPLPERLQARTNELLQQINSEKDVDGFSYKNRGELFYNREMLAPCTPKGIIKLMNANDIKLKGKDIAIVNHSNLVGKPLMLMMVNRNATVSVCHVHTEELNPYTSKADILVVGIGKPNFITKEMIKEGAVIIDVGINRVNGDLTGDVDFDNVYEKCGRITPVPGGVGPMTVAMLMQNTIICYKRQLSLED